MYALKKRLVKTSKKIHRKHGVVQHADSVQRSFQIPQEFQHFVVFNSGKEDQERILIFADPQLNSDYGQHFGIRSFHQKPYEPVATRMQAPERLRKAKIQLPSSSIKRSSFTNEEYRELDENFKFYLTVFKLVSFLF